MSFLFQPVADAAPKSRSAAEVMAVCMRDTFAVLSSAGLATETELARTRLIMEKLVSEGTPAELLEVLVKVQGPGGDFVAAEVSRIAYAMSMAMYPVPPLIPFAAKLISPTAFYERFPQVQAVGKLLMAPILYAEDTDAVGVGSVNPVAARVMAEELVALVDERTGIKPFVSAVRMTYDSWSFLTRKHFSL